MIADSGDFARRVDARARGAYESSGLVLVPWRALGDGQDPWIGLARTEELAANPSGSLELQVFEAEVNA